MKKYINRTDVFNAVGDIVANYDLHDEIDALNANTGKNNPYHNNYHTHCVMLNCYEGAQYHSGIAGCCNVSRL